MSIVLSSIVKTLISAPVPSCYFHVSPSIRVARVDPGIPHIPPRLDRKVDRDGDGSVHILKKSVAIHHPDEEIDLGSPGLRLEMIQTPRGNTIC